MSSEFIHPNWHVILVHYPLGLLGIGVFIELFSFLWRHSSFRAAGRWMILIGALSCIPAATSGIYALRDVVVPHEGPLDTDSTWVEVKHASQWNELQWHLMVNHLRLAINGTIIVVVAVCAFFSASDRWRRKLYFPAMFLLLVGLGVLGAAAWNSGEAIYTQGTAVEHETPSFKPPSTQPSHAATYYVAPLQLHTVSAGTVIAFALAALSLTLRRWNQESVSPVIEQADRVILEAVSSSMDRPRTPFEESDMTPTADEPFYPALYPARFWLITFVLAALTALGGLWVSNDLDLKGIANLFTDSGYRSGAFRLFFHVIFGVCIVVLPFLLAGFTRLTPRLRGVTLTLIALLLFAAVAQVYIGTFMTFDSMDGPLTHFNAPATQPD